MSKENMNNELSTQPKPGTLGKLSIKERKAMFRRWIFSAGLGWNFETQQGPAVAFSMARALRKIYPNDDDYIKAMDNHFKYYNATAQMGNVILGATLAMEEKDGLKAYDSVQSLKTSLMGPLSGVGDSIFWVLFPTIMGSIAGYMALDGNPTGAIIWMILYVLLYWVKMWLFNLGYSTGTKLISSLGSKLETFTDAISAMGVMVIGTLMATVVNFKTSIVFKTGKVSLSLQNDILDKIMPALLPVALTFFIYWLLGKKGWTPTKVILLIIVLALLGALAGIIAVPK